MENQMNYYSVEETIKLLNSSERLVYVDDGIDEAVIRYKDLPDFIVDYNEKYGSTNLKVYKYPAESMTPIITTIGYFLDKCDPDVRKDIIDRLIRLQQGGRINKYKIIDEYTLENARGMILKNLDIKIVNHWKSDYGDIRCNAIIYIAKHKVANVIVSFEEDENWKNNQDEYKDFIKANYEDFINLPKLSKCSKLMQEIYDNVCQSEATMCHITDDDWKEDYADRYSNKDIEKLKEEVKKYHLDDVISFDNSEYKIVGWGDLETSFNDD